MSQTTICIKPRLPFKPAGNEGIGRARGRKPH